MSENFKNQVIVVTGASAGLGRAITRAFAKQGANLGLLARGKDRLEAAVAEVSLLGGKALAIPCDVADAQQVEKAATLIESEFGPIDIWVNNAMTSVFSPSYEMEPEEYRRVTEVTYLGTVYGTLVALKRMRIRNHGRIIQVGSALAYRGIPLQSAYCGSKHAIRGFTDAVRTELLHEKINIKISCVHMPAMNTPQFNWVKSRMPNFPQPVPPVYQPEIAARAVVWVAQHYRRELKVGWITDVVVLGNKLFPGVGDWYLARQGYSSQQTDQPVSPNRKFNLWEPVPGDYSAHGVFDDISYKHSLLLNITMNKWKIIFVGLLFLIGVILATQTSFS